MNLNTREPEVAYKKLELWNFGSASALKDSNYNICTGILDSSANSRGHISDLKCISTSEQRTHLLTIFYNIMSCY